MLTANQSTRIKSIFYFMYQPDKANSVRRQQWLDKRIPVQTYQPNTTDLEISRLPETHMIQVLSYLNVLVPTLL